MATTFPRVPKIQLNDGHWMPAIGLGTFQGNYDYSVCCYTCNLTFQLFAQKISTFAPQHGNSLRNYHEQLYSFGLWPSPRKGPSLIYWPSRTQSQKEPITIYNYVGSDRLASFRMTNRITVLMPAKIQTKGHLVGFRCILIM